MRKLAVIGVVVLLAMVFGIPALTSAAAITGTFASSATAALLNVAPKIALGAFLVGLVMLCFHWTRKHAVKWIVGSIICFIGSAAVTVVAGWSATETQTVASSATSVASVMIAKVLSGLTAGIG